MPVLSIVRTKMIHSPYGGFPWVEFDKTAYLLRQDVATAFAIHCKVYYRFGTTVSNLPKSEALTKLMPRHAPQTKLCTYKKARELAAHSTLPNGAKNAWEKLCVTRDDIADKLGHCEGTEDVPPADSDGDESTEPQAGEMRCDAERAILSQHANLQENVVIPYSGDGVAALVRGTGKQPHAAFFHAVTAAEHRENVTFVHDRWLTEQAARAEEARKTQSFEAEEARRAQSFEAEERRKQRT